MTKVRGPGSLTVLRRQLEELWPRRKDEDVWYEVADVSASARSIGMLELADALLLAYDKRDHELLEQVLLPLPANYLAGVEKDWVVHTGPGMPKEQQFSGRLIQVQEDFRFEWFAYIDDSGAPRHEILISVGPLYETLFPTIEDVARGFDVERRRDEGYTALMLDDKIGHIRHNALTERNIFEFYPKAIHLWYDINAWQRLHDMFVRTWRNVAREAPQQHFHVLLGMRGYMPSTNVAFATHEAAVEYANDLAHQFGDDPDTEVEGDPETGDWDIDNNEYIEVTTCVEPTCEIDWED